MLDAETVTVIMRLAEDVMVEVAVLDTETDAVFDGVMVTVELALDNFVRVSSVVADDDTDSVADDSADVDCEDTTVDVADDDTDIVADDVPDVDCEDTTVDVAVELPVEVTVVPNEDDAVLVCELDKTWCTVTTLLQLARCCELSSADHQTIVSPMGNWCRLE